MLRWLNTLGGRVTLVLVASLLIAQVVSVFVLVDQNERKRAQSQAETFFLDIAASETLINTSRDINAQMQLEAIGSNGLEYWIANAPALRADQTAVQDDWPPIGGAWANIAAADKRIAYYPDARPFWMRYRLHEPPPPTGLGRGAGPPDAAESGARTRPPPRDGDVGPMGPPPEGEDSLRPPPPDGPGFRGLGGPPPPPGARPPMPQIFGEATTRNPRAGPRNDTPPVLWRVSIKLADGRWLNGEYLRMGGLPPWINVVIEQNLIILVIMLASIFAVVGFATKRLLVLSSAADKVGRGENLDPIPESGTLEVRRLTQSFNTMSLRLRRFIEARTQMLGAISHDLRTPITGLRLRAELVDDDENRERMLTIIDEIHHLTEATLALAREDSFTEVTDRVDLSALIESICDDLSDVGIDVSCDVPRGVSLTCRPYSLRRAIRNLAENGAKYGHRSRIHMKDNGPSISIVIDDDGPGIPEDQLDRVLLPFVRLENSRSRETGGAGLGLAITRSIVLNHGGELDLKNRPGGGLRATITLPVAA